MEQPAKNQKTFTQQGRLSDAEKKLLVGLFADNEALLLALRNLFFGFPLQDSEKYALKLLAGAQAKAILRKILLPELERDIPISQSVDLWMTVKLDDPARDKVNIKARQQLIDRIGEALVALDSLDNSGVSLEVEKTTEGLMNRNTYITHIETQLMAIRAIANEKQESEDEKATRLQKDSMK